MIEMKTKIELFKNSFFTIPTILLSTIMVIVAGIGYYWMVFSLNCIKINIINDTEFIIYRLITLIIIGTVLALIIQFIKPIIKKQTIGNIIPNIIIILCCGILILGTIMFIFGLFDFIITPFNI